MTGLLQLASNDRFETTALPIHEAASEFDDRLLDAYSRAVIRVADQASPSMVNRGVNQRLQAFGRCFPS